MFICQMKKIMPQTFGYKTIFCTMHIFYECADFGRNHVIADLRWNSGIPSSANIAEWAKIYVH